MEICVPQVGCRFWSFFSYLLARKWSCYIQSVNVHLGKFHNMEVYLQTKDTSVDLFIDDIFTFSIGYKHWEEQSSNVALLSIYDLLRPFSVNDPLEW